MFSYGAHPQLKPEELRAPPWEQAAISPSACRSSSSRPVPLCRAHTLGKSLSRPGLAEPAKSVHESRERNPAPIDPDLSNTKLQVPNRQVRLISHRDCDHRSTEAVTAMSYLCLCALMIARSLHNSPPKRISPKFTLGELRRHSRHASTLEPQCSDPRRKRTTIQGVLAWRWWDRVFLIPSRASIVIPAHNEAGRIRGLLETLTDPVLEGRLEIYVICNGCVDDTRQVAEEYSVIVVEIADVGKHFALNEGDRLAGDAFPRLYCDADIQVTPTSILTLIDSLDTDEVRVAGPEIRFDVEQATRPVKMFYRAEESPIQMRWQEKHLTGRGLYGASEKARRRFAEFPALVADDLFFDSQFTTAEKMILPGATSVLKVPPTFRELMRARIRVTQGNREYRAAMNVGWGALDSHAQSRTWFDKKIRSRIHTVRGWQRDLHRRDVAPMLFYVGVATYAHAALLFKKLLGRRVRWR